MNHIEEFRAVPLWSGHVARGMALLQAEGRGPAWRITRGVFCVEDPAVSGVLLLALPGDVVGVEAWCDQPYAHAVTALTGGHAVPEPAQDSAGRTRALAAAVLQQQRQMAGMARLRSGPVQARLARLLHLLDQGTGALALARKHLPPLKDLARVVEATPETVCRELNRLRPAAPRSPAVAGSAWLRAVSPFAPAC